MHSICQKWEHRLHYTPESSKIQKIHIMIFRFTPDIGLRYFQYKVVNNWEQDFTIYECIRLQIEFTK